MSSIYYEIRMLPDFTLSKYSALEEDGVEGALKRQDAFLRQLHRKCLNPKEPYKNGNTVHWICQYDPEAPAGNRMTILLKIDIEGYPSPFAESFAEASAISSLYKLVRVYPKNELPANQPDSLMKLRLDACYSCRASLIKKEKFSRAPLSEPGYGRRNDYYSVNKWEINEKARLNDLFSMMKQVGGRMLEAGKAENARCAYCVDFLPVDYSNVIEEPGFLGEIVNFLRQKTSFQVKSGSGSTSFDRDDSAEYTLERYQEIIKDISANPHFRANISAYAADEEYARMLLDAAASEALSEGSYDIRVQNERSDMAGILRREYQAEYSPRAQAEYGSFLPTLFSLKEMRPFVTFPALFPGETVELPKETAPHLAAKGLYLGKDTDGYPVRLPLHDLVKHAFVAGVPGAGKTNTMLHILTALHKNQVNFLVFEPAKKEYRALLNMHMKGVTVFSPSSGTRFPLHINPFEFPKRMSLSEHIENLTAIFEGAFDMQEPMPFLMDRAIERIYRAKGWHPDMINLGELRYPTMQDLYDELEAVLAETDYEGEIKGNLKSYQQVRVGSLLRRAMGDVFNIARSSLSPEEWLTHSAVIELESMGSGPANFLTLMLVTLIRETLKYNPVSHEEEKPRHVILFEEAHNLIGPSTEKSGEKGDTKVAATAFIVKMLAEVRALNEGIIIADQLPTAMAPEVIKNTSMKLGHKITAQDDRQLLGSTMSADEVQLERMASFRAGQGLLIFDKLLKPFEVQVEMWACDPDGKPNPALYNSPSDEQLVQLLSYPDSPYLKILHNSHRLALSRYQITYTDRLYDSILDAVKALNQYAGTETEETGRRFGFSSDEVIRRMQASLQDGSDGGKESEDEREKAEQTLENLLGQFYDLMFSMISYYFRFFADELPCTDKAAADDFKDAIKKMVRMHSSIMEEIQPSVSRVADEHGDKLAELFKESGFDKYM